MPRQMRALKRQARFRARPLSSKTYRQRLSFLQKAAQCLQQPTHETCPRSVGEASVIARIGDGGHLILDPEHLVVRLDRAVERSARAKLVDGEGQVIGDEK
jgi:hypothetical protein